MNIAYLISAHKDPYHLKRLITVLESDGVHFFIHIDKKVDIKPFLNLVKGSNIHYTPNRIWTQWGGFTQVLYQKELLGTALSYEKQHQTFDYFVILTGQDYPLMSNEELRKRYSDKNLPFMIAANISLHPNLNTQPQKDRIELYHFFRDAPIKSRFIRKVVTNAARLIMKLLPFRKNNYLLINGNKWDVYYASAMAALPHEAAAIAYDNLCNNKTLIKYFKTSFAPDELVIPTILYNTPTLRSRLKTYPNDGYFLKDVSCLEKFDYGSYVKVYTEQDYKDLVKSGKVFGRKFETGKSDLVMNLLDVHNEYKI
ncbi:MAG: beta-1,6-N-acetylglucosaminyltransferase [Prevotella sp.]|jgi:hypothetical protein|nr:beta-1,6-N-acetylglucosaminyltransferase [Prevotella sp.]MCI2080548.1 beta-1,6-N-acetylglucosaminyltransferase [Prevotella sp.]MCI2102365.1 beta-1,6-N-acetylglucosaminyltransferase [Prevotella sp.]